MNLSLCLLKCLATPRYEGLGTDDIYVLPDRLIYDMMEWIARSEIGWHPDRSQRDLFYNEYLRNYRPCEAVYENDFDKSIQRAKDLGICQNRLWNLLSGSPRQWHDLPGLVQMMDANGGTHAQCFHHSEDFSLRAQPASLAAVETPDDYHHQACTSDLCHIASMDSTRVVQRHKCPNLEACSLIRFVNATDDLSDDILWGCTIEQPGNQDGDVVYKPIRVTGDYIAISHVWSDGTGAGIQGRGMVNACLFRYFFDIARGLSCNGIWWDAICIPVEPKARARAIRNMQTYYSSATHTVIHDEYLVRFPWKDDGTPCLALVLSPWFTRGWTAVELMVSRSVKVLFKDPDGGAAPIVKDLEKDVLANQCTCSLGHLIASSIIRSLRTAATANRSLERLIQILKTRSNSRSRDRVVIAALLAGVKPDVDVVNMQTRVTQQTIASYPSVRGSVLIHGSPTITEHGPLSWCPSSIFYEGPTILSSDMDPWNQLRLMVDQETGALEGLFFATTLTTMRRHTAPFSTHPAVHRRLKSAWIQPDDYLVLSCAPEQRYLLVVQPKSLRETPTRAITCDWIGVIVSNISESAADHQDFSQVIPDKRILIGASTMSDEYYTAPEYLHLHDGVYNPNNRSMYSYLDWNPIMKGYVWNMETGKWEKAKPSADEQLFPESDEAAH